MHPAKHAAALAALEHVQNGMLLGVGTGSTANIFIDLLAASDKHIEAAVASSTATAERLAGHNIDVHDLNMTGPLSLYIDGADEANASLQLIKGGGGALTREKIVAGASERFICIADASKSVEVLGTFPLPIEVIPMARSFVAREIVKLGADPEYRDAPATDNGNIILDCYGLQITDAIALEAQLNAIPGVVTNGLFAIRPADSLILGHDDGHTEVRSAQ